MRIINTGLLQKYSMYTNFVCLLPIFIVNINKLHNLAPQINEKVQTTIHFLPLTLQDYLLFGVAYTIRVRWSPCCDYTIPKTAVDRAKANDTRIYSMAKFLKGAWSFIHGVCSALRGKEDGIVVLSVGATNVDSIFLGRNSVRIEGKVHGTWTSCSL